MCGQGTYFAMKPLYFFPRSDITLALIDSAQTPTNVQGHTSIADELSARRQAPATHAKTLLRSLRRGRKENWISTA
jgi:hypothetical protein